MSTAHNLESETPIRWFTSLRFVLFMLNLLLALIFGSIAFALNQQKIEQPLASAVAAVLDLQQDNLLEQVRNQTNNASHFSQALNAVAVSLWSKDRDLRALGRSLLAQIPKDTAIVAAGIWPEPRSFNRNRERYSFYWTLDQGEVNFHGDYNDPSNISYHGERWYTPLRYFNGPGCHWSGRYKEPFLKRPVIACSSAITINGNFAGVTNLVIDPARLSASTNKELSTTPFFLLLDGQQRILDSGGIQVAENDNLASLAQRDSRFGPVAVHLHEKSENALKRAQAQDAEWQKKLDALGTGSRDLSKLEAAQILATIQQSSLRESGESLVVAGNSLTQTTLRLDELEGIGTLLSGHDQSAKIAGMALEFWISAATTAGAVAIALLLSALFSSRTAVTPLRKLILQLRQPAEDTQLEESPANEIGMLARLLNTRHERIRMLLTSTRKATKPTHVAATTASNNDDADMGWVIVDALADSVVLTDMEGRIQYMNAAAETLSGSNIPQAQNLSFDEVFHVLDRRGKQRMKDLAQRTIKAGRASERPLQAVHRTRSGHNLPIAISSAPVHGARGETNGAVLIIHDARQTSVSTATGSVQELRDKLTGSLNRQAFDSELATRVEATRMGAETAFSLLYIDVDHMQELNAAFATEGGDEFLRQLSRLIQSDVGDSNPVYRLHGDKFAVLLSTDDEAEAQVTAELLRADVQSWGFQWKGEKREVSITASLLRIDKDSGRAVDILRLAVEVCQQAQNEGRGRIVTTQAHAAKNERRDDRGWLTTIKQGLSNDRFHLSTQQVNALQRNAEDGQIFDTLMLLEDEEGFWTGSDVFMPVAERHDMALQLDRWMIDQVFKRLREDNTLAGQMDFCMISLSVSSMQAPSFLDFMFENFKDSGISPEKVCLDLNEKHVHSRISAAREFCQTMSRAGCRLSLSGVSTRPSSYKLIKDLPIQIVRFDPLLTKFADSDPVDRLATESLHRIVHTLGRQSMATQVNSPELLRIMQGIGIHYAQGDAVARPSPILFHAQS